MNKRMIAFFVGSVLKIEGALILLPLLVSVIYRENEAKYIAAAALVCELVGFLLARKKPEDKSFYTREGIVAVGLSWLFLSLFGSLPYYSPDCPVGFFDALFETISGFTTTGASILTDVEALPKGVLFWRSFTHWVGGMGVLVFMLAVLPMASGENIYLMRAESPGPSVGKLLPKVKSTAKALYMIYLCLTAFEILLLWATGLDLFEASVLSFGSVGTGGFSIRNSGCADYTTLQQGIITAFMIACGVNFNIYFFIVAGNLKAALKSEEMWSYLGIMAASVLAISINVRDYFSGYGQALHHSLFNVASVMTTTGFATVNFDLWPTFSKMVLIFVMFVGGCAGSTAGGLKVSRIIVGLKTIRKELEHLIHPRSVRVIKFEGRALEHSVLRGINVYFMTYLVIFVASILLVSLDGKDVVTTVTSVVATFNNIGPGLGMVGPCGNFSEFSYPAKGVLMFDMLAGRLELFPMLLIFMPASWKRQK